MEAEDPCVAATISPVVNSDSFSITRRESAVLTVALAVVVGAVLLLVLAGNQIASALLGPG